MATIQATIRADWSTCATSLGADGATAATSPTPFPEPIADCNLEGSIARLAMLLTRADEQDRGACRQLEQAADHAATLEEDARVKEMQAKADDDLRQALASGIGEGAEGLLTVGSGFAGSPGPPEDGAAGSRVDWSVVLGGLAKVSSAGGRLVSGVFTAEADQANARAAKLDQGSQADARRASEAHEDVQAANDSIGKVQEFLKEVEDTVNAAHLAAATYRG